MPESSPPSDHVSQSLSERYSQLINQIVEMTLQGKIRSKEQVYQLLMQGVSVGTGEIFERCLSDRLTITQQQISTQTDEFKLAKANRILRALQTIQSEWERWQQQNQATAALKSAAQQITAAESERQLAVFLQLIDPNREQAIRLPEWKLLAQELKASAQSDPQIQEIAEGIQQALTTWQHLSNHLVSWMYDQSQEQLGFTGVSSQRGPWALWAKQVHSSPLAGLFQTLAHGRSPVEWASSNQTNLQAWIEMALVLQCLQQGLVNWFDQQVYSVKVGAKLSISTYLTFALLWSQLAMGFNQTTTQPAFVNGAFQLTLQILRAFAQRQYFPLYGGIFASFAGNYLRDALDYLDEPLRRTEGTQEKARIMVLLGYSLQVQGQYKRAHPFYQQALEIARAAGDHPCEIASLNHLSRSFVGQKDYAEAISHSQRALILSRQVGDRQGEANALANLGYSEVFQAQQEQAEPEVYESAINYLQQGLTLAERQGDHQSQVLCFSSLGMAYNVLGQYQEAIVNLEGAIQAAQYYGDLFLYGSNLARLAEAHYHAQNFELAIYVAALSMYLLEQIAAETWRQSAALLVILQGQVGEETFKGVLSKFRPRIIPTIGVDGYDHLPQLLEQYRRSIA